MDDPLSWLGLMAGGLGVTLQLTLIVGVLSPPLGMLVAILAISPWRLVRLLARAYSDVFRAIPLLVLMVFVYYVLGPWAGSVGLTAFSLSIIGLVINEAAYLSEAFRGRLLSIPSTQWEAAYSLGLAWPATIWRVVLPQALLPAVPSTAINTIQLVKDTSLASLVAVKEVTQIAQGIIFRNFRPVEVYLVLACVYMAIIIPLTLAGGWVEKRVRESVAS